LKYGVQIPRDVASPVCNLDLATRQAKERLFARRAIPQVRAAKKEIVRKHGSRKQLEPMIGRTKKTTNSAQMSWDF
jgi:deoxyribodipyrimidine photo-lyase